MLKTGNARRGVVELESRVTEGLRGGGYREKKGGRKKQGGDGAQGKFSRVGIKQALAI